MQTCDSTEDTPANSCLLESAPEDVPLADFSWYVLAGMNQKCEFNGFSESSDLSGRSLSLNGVLGRLDTDPHFILKILKEKKSSALKYNQIHKQNCRKEGLLPRF